MPAGGKPYPPGHPARVTTQMSKVFKRGMAGRGRRHDMAKGRDNAAREVFRAQHGRRPAASGHSLDPHPEDRDDGW